MKRENGFYWVKYKGNWQPALYAKNNTWFVINAYEGITESELDEVGEKLNYCTFCKGTGRFVNVLGELTACVKCG